MIFEQATRNKLRFRISNGFVTTEELWDLSLESLNNLARGLNKLLKDTEESFIEEKTVADKKLELMFEVVKSVIEVKLKDKKDSLEHQKKIQRRSELLEILNEKESQVLRSKSREEILKELEEL
jgi:hypothetical protein